MDWSPYQAVLFDLDGVLTDTASLHAQAWKQAFDEFLAGAHGEGFQPFDRGFDYRSFVDGRPRFEGVDTFLRSRNIILPWGTPQDPPGHQTICALGNLKNQLVGEILRTEGAAPYPGSLRLLERLAALGMPMAVVTSSANAGLVLEAAGIASFFTVRVDGELAAELGLAGKPAADPFLEAARRLGAEPAKTVVIEDAISGVAAGRAGGFGLVVGVDRHQAAAALRAAGAGLVVEDLSELL
jgi:beta-phosphoglucomutase family hydrolase